MNLVNIRETQIQRQLGSLVRTMDDILHHAVSLDSLMCLNDLSNQAIRLAQEADVLLHIKQMTREMEETR